MYFGKYHHESSKVLIEFFPTSHVKRKNVIENLPRLMEMQFKHKRGIPQLQKGSHFDP